MFQPEQIFEKAKQTLIHELTAADLSTFIANKERYVSYFTFFTDLQRLAEQYNTLIDVNVEGIGQVGALAADEGSDKEKLLVIGQAAASAESVEQSKDKNEELNQESATTRTYQSYNRSEESQSTTGSNEVSKQTEYEFTRQAWGGSLEKLNTLVPEEIVQMYAFEHGDFLYAKPLPDQDGRKRYFFELARKAPVSMDDGRVVIEMCVVKKQDGFLIVDHSLKTGNAINLRYQDVPIVIKLRDADVRKHNLEENDVVNIAYIKGDEQNVRVIYKHKTEEHVTVKTIKKGSKKRAKVDDPDEEVTLDQNLTGQTILIIGNEPDRRLYQEEIEQRGGKMLWADGRDSLHRFDSWVLHSDVVVYLLRVSSHGAMKYVKKLCKEANIPFCTTFTLSSNAIADLAENAVSTLTD